MCIRDSLGGHVKFPPKLRGQIGGRTVSHNVRNLGDGVLTFPDHLLDFLQTDQPDVFGDAPADLLLKQAGQVGRAEIQLPGQPRQRDGGADILVDQVHHATLAGHTFEHELAVAVDNGMLGSIDANRGDYQNGWDTDQFL